MTPSRTPAAVVTGVALIVLPLAALVLKGFSTGWLMLVIILGPILVLIAGYALQIVIAAQGFLSSRALFASAAARSRATVAAWLTLVGVVLLGVFLTDGGDVGYGSTFQVWLGAYGPDADAVHAATDALNDTVALVAAVAWVGGFVWLVAEWARALAQRSRARRAAAQSPGEEG
ncbi:hypothetical protein J4H92_03075 [Leucobacter weissii]|uniref:Uncharacterized protein n=1 Tax=Leucobacter weissii TaxID=1983706 RepID=A0A939MHB9_9MICO|nr:hypothetical protein [Leucobacter weissii]MBO1900929.1 hypothetical protein [Leucobacter weissii]